MSERSARPRRAAFFALKFQRLLARRCEMQTIGTDGFAILALIVGLEDAKRYQGAVRFYNDPLMAALGFRKWERLDAVRRKLVAAGWLHYEAPPAGSRGTPGSYWVTIPEGIDWVEETTLDEAESAADYPPQTDTVPQLEYPPNGDGGGYGRGYGGGEPSYPIPNPISPAHEACADEQIGKAKKRKPRPPSFTPEDSDLAQWFLAQVLAIVPTHKPPNLDKWANSIRLLRTIDKRTPEQIRSLVERAHRDSFWKANILCPDKLREKWDQLTAKLGTATTANNGSAYKILEPRREAPPAEVASNGRAR